MEDKKIAVVGNWVESMPLELTLHILDYVASGSYKLKNLKNFRLVNSSWNRIATPLLLSNYGLYLEQNLNLIENVMRKSLREFSRTSLQEMNVMKQDLKSILPKVKEKCEALKSFSKHTESSKIPSDQINSILAAISNLTSEFWILNQMARKIKSFKSELHPREPYHGEFWHPPGEPPVYPSYFPEPRKPVEPPDWKRDRMPPFLPDFPSSIGPEPQFYPGGGMRGEWAPNPNPHYMFGEPRPNVERPPEGDIPMQPNYNDQSSPFGSALPAPNPFMQHRQSPLNAFTPRHI